MTSVAPIETPEVLTAADLKDCDNKMAASYKFVIRNEAFFATILMGLIKHAIPEGTMGTDGERLVYCVRFVLASAQGKVTFVVLHEVLHVVSRHHLRRGTRDKRLWNNAGDYFINALLVRMGIPDHFSDDDFRAASRDEVMRWSRCHARPEYQMPEDGLFEPKYLGMSTDAIYDIIKQDEQDNPPPPPPPDGTGDPCEDGEPGDQPGEGEGPSAPSDNEGEGGDCPWGAIMDATDEDGGELNAKGLAEAERKLLQDIQNAVNIAKGRGQLPSFIEEAISELNSPSRDWTEEFDDMLADTIPADHSFARPNRFWLGRSPIIMPSVLREGLGHVGVFDDQSGSVSRKEHTQFMSDFTEILETHQPEMVTRLPFDYTAGDPEEIGRGDLPDYVRRRNGGTRFRAPFDRCEELGIMDDFDVIVVFTDGGDDEYPDFEPPCPVIWATTGAFWGGTPPFGRVVQIKFNR